MQNSNNNIAALFDMDGVLVHTNPYHKKAFKLFLDNHNVSLTDEELKEHVYGQTNSEIFPYIFKNEYTPEKGKKWADEKESTFRELYKDDVEPVKGLLSFLDELKKAEIKMAVGTSAPIENLEFIVDELQIRHYFDALLHAGDITESKPNPEIYLKAAERLKIDPKSCIVFEDSIAGVKAGLNGGMKVVAVTTTHSANEFEGADLIIGDFEELSVEEMLNLL